MITRIQYKIMMMNLYIVNNRITKEKEDQMLSKPKQTVKKIKNIKFLKVKIHGNHLKPSIQKLMRLKKKLKKKKRKKLRLQKRKKTRRRKKVLPQTPIVVKNHPQKNLQTREKKIVEKMVLIRRPKLMTLQ